MTRALGLGAAVEPQPLLGAAVHYLRGGSDAISELEPHTLAAHERAFGTRPVCDGPAGHALLTRIDRAALTGRGGGHFPVAAKWRRVLAARLHHPGGCVVVANGAESEPLSRKDVALLELRPHLVLDGLVCAAETLGAHEAVLWLHEDAHIARAAITRALAERSAHRGDDPPIRVGLGPSGYLTGESSAIVRALSGGPALPAFSRAPAAESGVGGRPTLVQNVETFARVGLLARDLDAATVLLTLSVASHGEQLVVVEHTPDTTLRHAVLDAAGTAPQAVLLGGYGGRWLGWQATADLTLGALGTGSARAPSLGAGVVVPLGADECGLTRTAEIVDVLATGGARQCGPCLFGLPAVAATASQLARGTAGRRDLRRLDRHLAEIDGRGACHHPDGVVRLVSSALETFADDVAQHRRGRCLQDAGSP